MTVPLLQSSDTARTRVDDGAASRGWVPEQRRRDSRQLQLERRRSARWLRAIVITVATLGVGLLLYPQAAAWFSALSQSDDVAGYGRAVEDAAADERTSLLEAAHAYNRDLPAGPLRDPYALGVDGQQTAIGDGSELYFDTLVAEGTDAMARIRIPTIDVDLSVFHGTDDTTLARGIGHLFGTALPVGGAGTHSVLTGHSGFVQSTLFDDVDELVVGDGIVVSTMGEDLHYEVGQIIAVLPNETEALRAEPGRDLLTLITCTPTGVNTHRLLVRAERVDAPAGGETPDADDSFGSGPVGFPWWMLVLAATPVVAYVTVTPTRRTGVLRSRAGGRSSGRSNRRRSRGARGESAHSGSQHPS